MTQSSNNSTDGHAAQRVSASPEDGLPIFLTVEQVAAMLQVSTKSILRWVAADPSMPVLRVGRILRFPREQLMQWFKSNSQGFGRKRTHKQAHDPGGAIATI
jgi:excisionase family DNA binding protein